MEQQHANTIHTICSGVGNAKLQAFPLFGSCIGLLSDNVVHITDECAVKRVDVYFVRFGDKFFKQLGIHNLKELISGFKYETALKDKSIIIQVFPLAISRHQRQRGIWRNGPDTIYQIAVRIIGIQIDNRIISALLSVLLGAVQFYIELVKLRVGVENKVWILFLCQFGNNRI